MELPAEVMVNKYGCQRSWEQVSDLLSFIQSTTLNWIVFNKNIFQKRHKLFAN